MNPEAFMQLAIEEARKSQTPFGAVIVEDGKVIERAGNTVETDQDPSCHAEVNVIRRLAKRFGNASPSGAYTLYSTCEPCAMCAATCLWAGIEHIVYGVGSGDFEESNPNMIDIPCEEVFQRSPNKCTIESGLLRDTCKQLHQEFPLEDL